MKDLLSSADLRSNINKTRKNLNCGVLPCCCEHLFTKSIVQFLQVFTLREQIVWLMTISCTDLYGARKMPTFTPCKPQLKYWMSVHLFALLHTEYRLKMELGGREKSRYNHLLQFASPKAAQLWDWTPVEDDLFDHWISLIAPWNQMVLSSTSQKALTTW